MEAIHISIKSRPFAEVTFKAFTLRMVMHIAERVGCIGYAYGGDDGSGGDD
jgi:hypothetical protein